MPIFIDMHESPTRATPERLASLHLRDVEYGRRFGVRWISYHTDFLSVLGDTRPVVQYRTFCIAEAPSSQAVQECHAAAHGHQANQIVAIQPGAAKRFLQSRLGLRPNAMWEAAVKASAHPDFTRRQQEVLRLIAAGQTNDQIAAQLCISPHTVARHVANIFDRAGLANRAEAAAHAQMLGLTSPTSSTSTMDLVISASTSNGPSP